MSEQSTPPSENATDSATEGASRAEVERIMDEMDPAYADKQAAIKARQDNKATLLGMLTAFVIAAVGFGIYTLVTGDDGVPVEPAAAPTAATPAPIDVTVLPDEITLEYVQATIDQIDAWEAEANRYAIETRDPEDPELFRLLSRGRSQGVTESDLETYRIAEQEDYWILLAPGAPRTQVDAVLLADPSCAVVRVMRDATEMITSREPFEVNLVLRPSQDGPMALEITGAYSTGEFTAEEACR